MDDVDRAQVIAEQIMATALAHHQSTRPRGESRQSCEECEEPIPEARRKAQPGCTRCIACQEQHELLAHWRQP